MPTFPDVEMRLENLLELLESGGEGVQPDGDVALAVREVLLQAEEKRDGVAFVIRRAEAMLGFYQQEMDALKDRKAAAERALNRLKSYIVDTMQQVGAKRLDGQAWTLRLQQNPGRVEVGVPVGTLPAELVRVIPEQREPDKAAIGKKLKDGTDVPGCRLIPGSWWLVAAVNNALPARKKSSAGSDGAAARSRHAASSPAEK
jgi:hypothetical protein